MPYIGRELDSGNYLKLDDISSSFNGSTTTFNLTAGGKAFFPGSAFSILVNLAGVAQEPEAAYQINNSQITFATAPASGDQFFCIVLGVAHGINVPGNGTVDGAQLAKPFNYDGYFYLDEANNRVGVGTATPSKPLHVVGEGQFDSVRVLGDLTVDGTTTTLDTVVTEVDRLEVGANNSTVGLAVTQSGSGDAAIFMGGKVGIGTDDPDFLLHSRETGGSTIAGLFETNQTDSYISFQASGTTASSTVRIGAVADNFTAFVNGAERLRIKSNGRIAIGADAIATYPIDIRTDENPTSGVVVLARNNQGNGNGSFYAMASNLKGSYSMGMPSNTDAFTIVDGFGNDGTERLRITSAGSVGIGTNSPQSQFEVFGSSPIVRSKHSTSQKYTQINHNGTDGYVDWSSGNLIFRGASNAERLRITSGGEIVSTNGTLRRNVSDSSFTISGDTASNTGANINLYGASHGSLANVFRVRIGASEKLRITSDGSVGIGLTNPESYGNFADDFVIYNPSQPGMTLASGTSGYGSIYFADGTVGNAASRGQIQYGHSDDYMAFATAATERLRIDSSGRLLLNTTTEGETTADDLTIATSGSTGITIRSGTSAEGNIFFSDGTSGDAEYRGMLRYEHNNDAMVIKTASTEKLRITSDGKVGVGAENPQATLQIGAGFDSGNPQQHGTLLISADNSLHNYIRFTNGGAGETHYPSGIWYQPSGRMELRAALNASSSNAAQLVLASNGNVGVRIATPTGNFEVNGNDGVNISNANRTGTNGAQWRLIPSSGGSNTNAATNLRLYEGAGAVEVLNIQKAGQVMLGHNEMISHANMDDLQIGDASGNRGITICSGTTAYGTVAFGDSTDGSGTDRYAGFVEYYHNDNSMRLGTSSAERLRIASDGDVLPGADATQDLGSATKRWANIHSADLQLSNEGAANDVDGTWGQYTIQEGEDDLFLINRRNGKKYKFMLQEVN